MASALALTLVASTTTVAASPEPATAGAPLASSRPAPASPDAPDDGHDHDGGSIDLGDDYVLPEGMPARTTSALGDRGFNLFPGGLRTGSQYTLRLMRSPGVAAYRPFAAQAAQKLNGVLGPYFTSEDELLPAPSNPGNFQPKAFQLRIIVSETSPCGTGNWIGCGGPDAFKVIAGQQVWAGGRVWLKPDLANFPDSVKTQVILHELGHALMLDHYDSLYRGKFQIMRSVADGNVTSYRAGDRNGLRATRGRAPTNDALAEATPISVGTVRDAKTWFARADSGDPELTRRFANASRRSVWYRFRAGENAVGRQFVIETTNDGSDDFDTVLGHVIDGEFRRVDNNSGAGDQSRIMFRPLDTTTVHYFAVDGINRARGITQVQLSLVTSG